MSDIVRTTRLAQLAKALDANELRMLLRTCGGTPVFYGDRRRVTADLIANYPHQLIDRVRRKCGAAQDAELMRA